MSMYTDPGHIRVEDPGKIEGNTVFTYLDALANDEDFRKYLPEYKNLEELKNHYKRGGLGDVKIKKFLFNVLNEELTPIRKRREELSHNLDYVDEILKEGTKKARKVAQENIVKFKKALRIDYF